MPMNYKQILDYYSRDDVQNALLAVSEDREVVGIFKTGAFGQRPNLLVYPEDVVSMVRSGNVAFHGSVERWNNPMSLRPGMAKEEMDELRKGFELIIDLDIKVLEYAKIYAKVFYDELRSYGIKNIGVKYTGGKSFHMAVPFESFPENVNYKPTRTQYPLIPQAIVSYLKTKVIPKFRVEILKVDDIYKIARKLEIPVEDLIIADGLDVDKIINPSTIGEMDEVQKSVVRAVEGFVGRTITEFGLFTSRHMFRLPYSLHESSFRASLPIKISQIDKFEKDDALPDKVKVKETFIDRNDSGAGEMTALVTEAMDWYQSMIKEETVKKKFSVSNTSKVTAEFFPPCIHKIMEGMSDGRKRSVLILFNFLRNMNWKDDETENFIVEWNQKNKPSLPSNYIRSQMRWLRASRVMMPPNFENENFYKPMGINCDIELKSGARNPVTYAIRSFKAANRKIAKKPAKKRKATHAEDEYVSG